MIYTVGKPCGLNCLEDRAELALYPTRSISAST
jgi:hypothetical protein